MEADWTVVIFSALAVDGAKLMWTQLAKVFAGIYCSDHVQFVKVYLSVLAVQ